MSSRCLEEEETVVVVESLNAHLFIIGEKFGPSERGFESVVSKEKRGRAWSRWANVGRETEVRRCENSA